MRDPHDYSVEKPTAVIDDLARIVAPKGRLGIIGVFLDSDSRARDEAAQRGEYLIPWGTLFKKGVTIGMGRDDQNATTATYATRSSADGSSPALSSHIGCRFAMPRTHLQSLTSVATAISKSCSSLEKRLGEAITIGPAI